MLRRKCKNTIINNPNLIEFSSSSNLSISLTWNRVSSWDCEGVARGLLSVHGPDCRQNPTVLIDAKDSSGHLGLIIQPKNQLVGWCIVLRWICIECLNLSNMEYRLKTWLHAFEPSLKQNIETCWRYRVYIDGRGYYCIKPMQLQRDRPDW